MSEPLDLRQLDDPSVIFGTIEPEGAALVIERLTAELRAARVVIAYRTSGHVVKCGCTDCRVLARVLDA